MNSFNKLLIENYYKNLLSEGPDSPPPPPGTPINPGGWWQDSNGKWHQIVPPDQPEDLVPIETEPDPQEIDPGDITLHGHDERIPPKPPDEPGKQHVLFRKPVGVRPDGTPIYEYYWETINENTSLWRNLIRFLTRAFIPGVGWVLFNPFEQPAGGSDLLWMLNDPYYNANQYGLPYGGGWDNINDQPVYA